MVSCPYELFLVHADIQEFKQALLCKIQQVQLEDALYQTF
jgi:hypothetical protein